jgi:hypothetical protein
MSRRPRAQRTPEEKGEIVQEGMQSGLTPNEPSASCNSNGPWGGSRWKSRS